MRHTSFFPEQRCFLFLQGPYGSFFKRLGERLLEHGHRVERINLNGGDRHDWAGGGSDFDGRPDEWPLFIDRFFETDAVTDLVLYGDCRPMHRAAHGIARLRGCRVHVFEEGYIRPDYMTLERDGVNGNSTLSSDPDWYIAEAAALPPIEARSGVPASFERRVREAIAYHLATAVSIRRFPHHRRHRPNSALVEAAAWIRRVTLRRRDRRRSARNLTEIAGRRYFCVPLQLSSDHQIRTHSPFPNMPVALSYMIRSFAEHAPADTVLVVKQHPLAYDLIGYSRIIQREAQRFGVPDRVIYVQHADVDALVAGALGVVTVNSTTGTLALRSSVPTIVLGSAVYDMPRITHQGALDAFWLHPVPPEPEVYDAFCRVLIDRCLVHGGYLSEEGLDQLVEGSIARLERDPRAVEARQTAGRT